MAAHERNQTPTFRAIANAINHRIETRGIAGLRFGLWNSTNAGWGRRRHATVHRHAKDAPLLVRLITDAIVVSSEAYCGDLNDTATLRRGDEIADHLASGRNATGDGR